MKFDRFPFFPQLWSMMLLLTPAIPAHSHAISIFFLILSPQNTRDPQNGAKVQGLKSGMWFFPCHVLLLAGVQIFGASTPCLEEG